MKEHRDDKLAEAICLLCSTIQCWMEQQKADNETKHSLHRLEERLENIMATQAELTADLKLVLAQQQKTAAEIADLQAGVDTLNDKVIELEEIIATGVAPSQELTDAVAAVKAQAQVIDDLVPDLPTPPPAP